MENAAEQLANSRRWKLANVGAVIKAKLSRGKVSTGYDPLDKIFAAYSRWRASHPAIDKLDDEIDALQLQNIQETPATEREEKNQSPSLAGNGNSGAAFAAKTSAIHRLFPRSLDNGDAVSAMSFDSCPSCSCDPEHTFRTTVCAAAP